MTATDAPEPCELEPILSDSLEGTCARVDCAGGHEVLAG
jgi:hypothetical protein